MELNWNSRKKNTYYYIIKIYLYSWKYTYTRTHGNVLGLIFEQCTRTHPSPMYSYFTDENVIDPRSALAAVIGIAVITTACPVLFSKQKKELLQINQYFVHSST